MKDKTNVLWQFYTKKFIIEGKSIDQPSNSFFYLLTALKGFILWLKYEVKLGTLWLNSLMATIFLIFTITLLPEKEVNNFIVALFAIFVAVWIFVVYTAMFVTVNRTLRTLESRAPLSVIILAGCFFLVLVIDACTQGYFWNYAKNMFVDVFSFFANK